MKFHLPVFRYIPLSEKRPLGFFSLGVLLIWMQGTAPGQAQNASTNALDNPAPPALTATLPSTNSQDLAPPAMDSTPAPTTTKTPGSSADATLDNAVHLFHQGKSDDAISAINSVLQADPKNRNAYILRGYINTNRQLWDQAEKDFNSAQQLDPSNNGIRYDIADLKFKEKNFDDARIAFIPLQDYPDDDIQDLIKYKIFLCDLFGNREELAAKELDAFNKAGTKASYYYSNAAWDLVHKKNEDARSWLLSASHIYSERKQLLYASILKDMGYLPLPDAPDKK